MQDNLYKRLIGVAIVIIVTIAILIFAKDNPTTKEYRKPGPEYKIPDIISKNAQVSENSTVSGDIVTITKDGIIVIDSTKSNDNKNDSTDTKKVTKDSTTNIITKQDNTIEYTNPNQLLSDYINQNTNKSEQGESEEEHNNIEYIIDVTSIDKNLLYGDTATVKGYSGRICADISNLDIKIETDKTYVITAKSLINMGDIPKVQAVKIIEADENHIKELDHNRETISNYKECLVNYSRMDLNSIIDDANKQYIYWSQDERKAFIEYIKTLGYNDTANGALKIKVYGDVESPSSNIIVE